MKNQTKTNNEMTNENYEFKHSMLLNLENSIYDLYEKINRPDTDYSIMSEMSIYSERIGNFETNPTQELFDSIMHEGLNILADISVSM